MHKAPFLANDADNQVQCMKIQHSLSPVITMALLLAGCANSPNVFAPKGPAAAEIARLGWLLVGLGAGVFLLVMGLLLYAIFRRRHADTDAADGRRTPPSPAANRWVMIGGVVFPTVILAIILFFTITTLRALSAREPVADLTVEVIGRQWWWEVHYPNQQIVTANEIHIPVGQPVRMVLKAGDVIHSFWVPDLHGKLDMIPGQENEFWLQADHAGEYWGECTEFCGLQHAKMNFVVVAEQPDEFSRWLERERQPAVAPTDPLLQQGQALFLDSTCAYCHAIQGTAAVGTLGPDLTHLASRRTLAAGAVRNTPGHLAGWIVDPQHIKPGNLMPASHYSGPELQALLAYLLSLQ